TGRRNRVDDNRPLRIFRREIRSQDLDLRNHIWVRIYRRRRTRRAGILGILTVLGNSESRHALLRTTTLAIDDNVAQTASVAAVSCAEAVDTDYRSVRRLVQTLVGIQRSSREDLHEFNGVATLER